MSKKLLTHMRILTYINIFIIIFIIGCETSDRKNASNSENSDIDEKINAMQGKWCMDLEENEDMAMVMLLFHLDDEKDESIPTYEFNGKDVLLKFGREIKIKGKLKEKENKLYVVNSNSQKKYKIINIIKESNKRKMKMITESEGKRDTTHLVKCSYYKDKED